MIDHRDAVNTILDVNQRFRVNERYLADGKIEYLGRNDQQIKVRGYRIELLPLRASDSGSQ